MPRSDPKRADFVVAYERALEAWFGGDYQGALDILARAEPTTIAERVDRALLAARASTRARDYERAVEEASIALSAVPDVDRRATALMLLGSARARLGTLTAAAQALDQAARCAPVHRTIRAEIALQTGFLSFKTRDLGSARTAAREAVRDGSDIVLARAHELLAHVDAAEGHYAQARTGFTSALRTLDTSRHHDALLEANVLHMAAALSLEALELDGAAKFEARLLRLPRTHETRVPLFQASQAVGLMHAVAGDEAAAWRLLHDALAYAHGDTPFYATALTTLATYLRIQGDQFGAKQHVVQAGRLLEKVDWEPLDGDRRVALLEWAIESARAGLPGGRAAVQRFERLSRAKGDKTFDVGDRRVAATLSTARALVAGDLDGLHDVLDVWQELEYTFRAASVAFDAAQLSGDGKDLAVARSLVRRTRGMLQRQIAGLAAMHRSGYPELTAAERRVLDAILRGMSAREIADATGRAPQTIKNQTREVFAKLGVNSRPELLVLCRDLGLTG